MKRTADEPSRAAVARQGRTFQRTLKVFRARVRELRQMHGFSYEVLSQRSKVHRRQLIAIETGEPVNPTLVTLTRLADAFGIDAGELLVPASSGIRRRTEGGPARVDSAKKPAKSSKKKRTPRTVEREAAERAEPVDVLLALTRLAEKVGVDPAELLEPSTPDPGAPEPSSAKSPSTKSRSKKAAG